ncbi:hypothetical protein ABEV00_29405 [Paenibacillus thiaminolyticus]|uniref:hypothetical protein n=1 Tax=Paenibacillus thiaminolyticus TaxID=49283 RepID=UPI0026802463
MNDEGCLGNRFVLYKVDPIELAVLLAAFYRLCRSEVVGFKPNAVDFKNKTITIQQ